MLSQGYAGTSVDAICKKAGLTKGGFYHFFASKDELGLAVLEWSLAKGGEIVHQGPHQKMSPTPGRAIAFLEHVESVSGELWSNGCLLGTYAVELAGTNDPMQEAVSRMFNEVAELFARELSPLGSRSKEMAQQFLALLEGSIILARAHRDPSRISSAIRTFRIQVSEQAAARL